jgi:hypothetical protein
LAQYLVKLLGEHVGHAPRRVNGSTGVINIINSLCAGPEDIPVSSDVVSLFTMVPTGEAQSLLSRHFGGDILTYFRLVPTSSFFMFNGQFYEQTDGAARGSPLSRHEQLLRGAI